MGIRDGKNSVYGFLMLVVLLGGGPVKIWAQGALVPPGAPAPTMKTLNQIEPRIPIDATNTPGDADSVFVIAEPGSYYLTGNVNGVENKNGIKVTANNVTIDLMGYSLLGVSGSLNGVLSSGTHVSLRNGLIQGWGACGADMNQGFPAGVYENLFSSNNNVFGLTVGSGAIVANCSFNNNIASGLSTTDGAVVTRCVSRGNEGDGFTLGGFSTIAESQTAYNSLAGIATAVHCRVIGCAGVSDTQSAILAGFGSFISECALSGTGGAGIVTGPACIIERCIVTQSGSTGIEASNNCRITGNICEGNAESGIFVSGTANHVDSNTCTDNGYVGVESNDGGVNVIVRNFLAANPFGALDVDTTNFVGPLVTSPADTNFANPTANIIY